MSFRFADRSRLAAAAIAAAASLSGCGGRSDAAGPTVETGGTMLAASTGGAAGPCMASTLPITGVCTDANPKLFLKTDPTLDTFATHCVWRTEEVKTGDDEALVFRAQDCTGEKWDKTVFSFVSNYVKYRASSLPDTEGGFALQVFPVAKGQTAEQVALQTLGNAPDDQRTRCITYAVSGVKAAGRVFELGPNPELKKELEDAHPDEPWEACGPNGVTM
ncbi:MAG TPA: hypothetical protein VG942_03055, partial [Hyphomonadaceae bacterium]|nr:hypothetical protein [Hyphomonadaceae bacterium]